ncbi:MAG: hypothetical protein JST92_01640 [Deltaproteobacteria bacterium]|nr:hypothetical protein [Deltaproteobacteria bacterium]
MRCSALALVIVAVGAHGCSSGASDAAGFALPYADAVCEAQIRCQALAGYVKPTCTRLFLESHTLAVAEANGRIRFDPETADACLTMLARAGCSFGFVYAHAYCARAVAPLQGGGAACDSDFECQTGVCSASGDVCPGACATPAPALQLGDPCVEGDTCQPGHYCAAGRCHSPDVGTPCTRSAQCLPAGLVCDPDTNACQPAGLDGSACSSITDCADGHFCGSDARCHPLLANGANCATHEQCQVGSLCRRPVHGAATCQRAAEIGEGCIEAPGAGFGLTDQRNSGCRWGLICSPLSHTCREPPSSGPCLPFCRADLSYCDSSTGTCEPRKAEGEPCSGSDCQGGLVCEPRSATDPSLACLRYTTCSQ